MVVHRTPLAGGVVAWRETGDGAGPPVLALHGLASTGATWDRVAAALAGRGRRVLVPDLRGHGGSSRSGPYTGARLCDDVVALLDHRGEAQVDVLGHSLGGHVALLLAQRDPQRVRRLLLEYVSPPPRTAGDRTVRTVRERVVLAAQSGLLVTRRGAVDLRAVRPLLREVLRTPDPGWWAALARVRCPVLLVGGGSTSHVSQDRLRLLADALPQSRSVTVDGAGHRVHSRRPDAFLEAALPLLVPS